MTPALLDQEVLFRVAAGAVRGDLGTVQERAFEGVSVDGAGIDRPSFLVSDEVEHDGVLDQVSGFGWGGWLAL
jgi:hypothetical protein